VRGLRDVEESDDQSLLQAGDWDWCQGTTRNLNLENFNPGIRNAGSKSYRLHAKIVDGLLEVGRQHIAFALCLAVVKSTTRW
jgi:hypothetical protein